MSEVSVIEYKLGNSGYALYQVGPEWRNPPE